MKFFIKQENNMLKIEPKSTISFLVEFGTTEMVVLFKSQPTSPVFN